MLETELHYLSLAEIRDALSQGHLAPSEVCESTFRRIERLDSQVNSFLSLDRKAGEKAGRSKCNPEAAGGKLSGIPLSVKDLITTDELPTTAGSRVSLKDLELDRNADVVQSILGSGGLLVGKNSLHEFAFGITNENEHFGPCRNPWDLSRMSGGSSGGSAAAVAAGLCYGSIGTDTRGSIRIPSACCGVSGLKPTVGRISTNGVIPLSSTLDHVGPIARTVEDLAILFDVLAGRTGTTSVEKIKNSPRIGVCPYFKRKLAPEVDRAVAAAEKVFEEAGARFITVDLPIMDDALWASDIISRWQAFHFHAPFLKQQGALYGPKVRSRLESGAEVEEFELKEALRIRQETRSAFASVFKHVDSLIAATLPVAAPEIGSETVTVDGKEEDIITAFVRLNAPQNVSGIPALALPCGFDSKGLPISFQLIADVDREVFLFQLGCLYQERTDWHRRRPLD